MDTLAQGIHYGLFDYRQAMSLSLDEWTEFIILLEKVSKLRLDEQKSNMDYLATQSANKIGPIFASVAKTVMKFMARRKKG